MNVDATSIFGNTNKNYFSLGQYDLFITSQITDKVSFLGETVFKYENRFNVNIERAIIKYQFKDYFNLSVGKVYTPLGYWNNAFHHGLVLQPTISRPQIVQEDYDGGGLPLEENAAVQLNGEGITKMNFGYNLMVGNGIASSPVDDFNNSKSVCLNIHAEPVENLKFYISGYKDDVPKGATTLQGILLTQKTNLQILNGSIAYMDGRLPIEFAGEFYNLKTTNPDSNITTSSNGYFLYLGYKIKKINIVPYLYYSKLDFDNNELFFAKTNTSSIVFGLRYKMHPLSVIKLEYKYSESKMSGNQNSIVLQFAIGF